MASSKEYLEYILEQMPSAVTFRAMMGEFVLYYKGKVFGGIYDDRLLVKPTKSALSMLPDARKEIPYEGAKEMLLVEETDDKELLKNLLDATFAELPAPKKK